MYVVIQYISLFSILHSPLSISICFCDIARKIGLGKDATSIDSFENVVIDILGTDIGGDALGIKRFGDDAMGMDAICMDEMGICAMSADVMGAGMMDIVRSIIRPSGIVTIVVTIYFIVDSWNRNEIPKIKLCK